ncbi:MAG: leucine-rich repeat domain-containing protein [Lachnospiraceae bacterium]|nr:leucine-rich repeat domain-containing protein [Lachnospiraceae bacterium]
MKLTECITRFLSVVLVSALVLGCDSSMKLVACADTSTGMMDSNTGMMGVANADLIVNNFCYKLNEAEKTATLTGCESREKAKGELKIPATVEKDGISYQVTVIGAHAFDLQRGFKGKLTIPNTVTTIEEYAFYNCSGLTGNLTIPNSVISVGNYGFAGCRGFNGKLKFGKSVKKIGDYAFANCEGLTGNLKIPARVTKISSGAFFDCYGLTGNLKIPTKVTKIETGAFWNCYRLNGTLTIPKSVKKMNSEAFYGCLFKKIDNKSKCKYHFNFKAHSHFLIVGTGRSTKENVLELDASDFYYCYVDKKGKPCYQKFDVQDSYTGKKIQCKPKYGKGPYVLKVTEKIDNSISFGNNKVEIQNLEFPYTLSASCQFGAVAFKKISGNKNISISKYGEVKVKNLKKGTYKVKVKMTSPANVAYKSCRKTATVKVVVK